MTPAEVRAIVERVVVEHGCGWDVLSPSGGTWTTVAYGLAALSLRVSHIGPHRVTPQLDVAEGDAEVEEAVALWPEMQRLCAMLREALAGPKAAT